MPSLTQGPQLTAQLVGVTGNPSGASQADATNLSLMMGRHNELLVSQIGGRFSALTRRATGGNVYLASTLIAGVTIPVLATTLASTAGIINPVGSGVNVELIALSAASTTIQVAVKNMVLAFHKFSALSEATPSSVTALAEHQMPIGKSGSASCHAHTAATFTNAAALGPLYYPWPSLMTAVGAQPATAYFQGEITFGPGVAFALANSTTALAGQQITYIWAEWPV